MATQRTTQTADPAPTDDPLLAAAAVRGLAANATRMTLWRWVKAGIIPTPIVIRGRNYWRRSTIVAALSAMEHGAPAPQPPQLVRARAATRPGTAATRQPGAEAA